MKATIDRNDGIITW